MLKQEKSVINEYSVWRFLTRDRCSASYFIRHVFCFLREHPDLLQEDDYKCLYEETLNYQIENAIKYSGLERCEYERNRSLIEYLADLSNKEDPEKFEKYSKDIIDEFLGYQRETEKMKVSLKKR